MTFSNKRPTENFLVAKPLAAAVKTDSFAGTRVALAAAGAFISSGALTTSLIDGQLGFLKDSFEGSGTYRNLVTTLSSTISPVLRIVQGNANTQNLATATATYPLSVRPYEQSGLMDVRNGVYMTKQDYHAGNHSGWVIGNTAGQSNAINIQSLTEYGMNITYRGRRVMEYFSSEEAANLRTSVVTPDFTAAGYTTDLQKINYIVTNLAYNINKNSSALTTFYPGFNQKNPVLAFLLDTAGNSTAVANGTFGPRMIAGPTNPLAIGDVFPVVGDGTTNYNVTITPQILGAIQMAVANCYTGANLVNGGTADDSTATKWRLMPINIANATSSVTAANSSSALLIISLDEALAYVDYIPQTKVRLQIGLTSGFNTSTVRNLEGAKVNEGQGIPRQLDLLWKATQGQRLYNLRHVEDPIPNYASPIDLSLLPGYTVFNIVHERREQIDMSNTSITPAREIVAIPYYAMSGQVVPPTATATAVRIINKNGTANYKASTTASSNTTDVPANELNKLITDFGDQLANWGGTVIDF